MNIYKPVTKLCIMGMLSALSVVLAMVVHFPLIPVAPYLEYDPADIPILLAAYLYGPIPALAVTLVTSVLQGLTVSANSGIIGIIMHFLATGFMASAVGLISDKGALNGRTILASVMGCISMILIMIPLNMIFTPLYTGMTTKAVSELLIPAIIPFNAIKAGINSAVALVIFAPLGRTIGMKARHRAEQTEDEKQSEA